MSGAPIRLLDVSRSYGQVVALNEVTLDLEPGVIGLLGPNGAGKSTMLRILTGELRPTLGEASVLGLDPFANPDVYHRIGICPEQDALFEDLGGREFLSVLLRLRGFDPSVADARALEWIERMGLEDAMNRRLRGYSKGMRQRVKLATAFAHEPDVLFLDEPLTGLDPLWRHRVQRMVREMAENGATVLFSSHVLLEVEQVTREVVLLHRGRVAAQGNAREIRALIDHFPHRVVVAAARPRDLALRLISWDVVDSVGVHVDHVDLTTSRPATFYERLTAEAADADLGILGLESPDDSLQALFEALVDARRPAKVSGAGARRKRAAKSAGGGGGA